MSKYTFNRMSPEQFEAMAQALLEKRYRIGGKLIQFGAGKDGAREATWTQGPGHHTYSRPANEEKDVPKEWVFQVKYHDLGLRSWSSARDAMIPELESELGKLIHKYRVPCHAYVLITNVPFTGARWVGTRDKVTALQEKWQKEVPEILVWDAADLSKMLDADEDVRTAYLDTILPGDVLKAIYQGVSFRKDRVRSTLLAYLTFVTEWEASARAEEAGDEPGLPLADVFIDLTLKPGHSDTKDIQAIQMEWRNRSGDRALLLPEDLKKAPASFAFLLADHPRLLLLGGPGLGKSTLTQFLALYQAARAVDKKLVMSLIRRLKLPMGLDANDLDARSLPRFPLRIELRRYARWLGEEQKKEKAGELARYIAEVLINPNTSGTLGLEDIFNLAASDPILLLLDGFDEVPHPDTRKTILENLHIFLRRVNAEEGDIQLVLSSRPKGYSGEFETFKPLPWELNKLERPDFDDYCKRWIEKRIRGAEEQRDAHERIERGMKSEAVQRLAGSLLQATVMLTIVRRKSEIPHQRHALYQKYVDVIFDREKEKWPVVREWEDVLRCLHEQVGYELHRSMEQSSLEALDGKAFRSYVSSMLEEYTGLELGNRKIREIVDEIIAAATDRLCLLVGKGKDQKEIDFIVQLFREFFAARYLFNHPEANPDRVFAMLVERGAYWANVLQLYVALASAGQQMQWLISTGDSGLDRDSAENIIWATRTRRALLQVLPEFKLQRKTDFKRALREIFHKSTLWTWTKPRPGRERTELNFSVEILKVLRFGGLVAKTFETMFADLAPVDEAVFSVEVKLLAEYAARNSGEHERLRNKLQSLLEQKDTRWMALMAVMDHDLEIDLFGCPLEEYPPNVRVHILPYPYPARLFQCQTREKQCELILGSRSIHGGEEDALVRYLEKLTSETSEIKTFTFSDKSVTLHLESYFSHGGHLFTGLSSYCEELEAMNSNYAKYLSALIRAGVEPTNLALDERAERLDKQLAPYIAGKWRKERMLGPSPSLFPSPSRWQQYKRELFDLTNLNPHWIVEDLKTFRTGFLWTALLFHPDDWHLLLEQGLFSEKEFQIVSKTNLAR